MAYGYQALVFRRPLALSAFCLSSTVDVFQNVTAASIVTVTDAFGTLYSTASFKKYSARALAVVVTAPLVIPMPPPPPPGGFQEESDPTDFPPTVGGTGNLTVTITNPNLTPFTAPVSFVDDDLIFLEAKAMYEKNKKQNPSTLD